jgi:hypothetical protein
MSKPKLFVDILELEAKSGAPNWLTEYYAGEKARQAAEQALRLDAIRKRIRAKHRARHLTKLAQDAGPPDEPRGKGGKWIKGGEARSVADVAGVLAQALNTKLDSLGSGAVDYGVARKLITSEEAAAFSKAKDFRHEKYNPDKPVKKTANKEPVGTGGANEPEDATLPSVDWYDVDLEDSGKRVTPESIMKDYGRGKGIVYRSWVDIGDIPKPKGFGISKDGYADEQGEEGSYWGDYRVRGDFPPVKLLMTSRGLKILDGNHRLAWWRGGDVTHVPAWIVDERPGVTFKSDADDELAQDAGFDPTQPRESTGQWTKGGVGILSTKTATKPSKTKAPKAKTAKGDGGYAEAMGRLLNHGSVEDVETNAGFDQCLTRDGPKASDAGLAPMIAGFADGLEFFDKDPTLKPLADFVKHRCPIYFESYYPVSGSMATGSTMFDQVTGLVLNTSQEGRDAIVARIVDPKGKIANYGGEVARRVYAETHDVDKAVREYYKLCTLHECGHIIDLVSRRQLSQAFGAKVKNIIDTLHGNDFDIAHALEKTVAPAISDYACAEPMECWAEAFSRVISGGKLGGDLAGLTDVVSHLANNVGATELLYAVKTDGKAKQAQDAAPSMRLDHFPDPRTTAMIEAGVVDEEAWYGLPKGGKPTTDGHWTLAGTPIATDAWSEAQHPRAPSGAPEGRGGQFTRGGATGAPTSASVGVWTQESGNGGHEDARGAERGNTDTDASAPNSGAGSARNSGKSTAGLSDTDARQGAANAGGIGSVAFPERAHGSGDVFAAAISDAKASNQWGAAVTLYPTEEYNDMRLFLAPDNLSGYALHDGDIISVFKHQKCKEPGVASRVLKEAVANGGDTLDCFDTQLPKLYSKGGFRAVARLPFNPEYQPEGWDYAQYADFNGGKPDVVFMVYDPNAKLYKPGDGVVVDDYDAGKAAQQAALAELKSESATQE